MKSFYYTTVPVRTFQICLLILLLLPVTALCQCPDWIGSSIDKAEALKPIVQKYFQGNFVKVADSSSTGIYQNIIYQNDKEQVLFQIGWYSKREWQGNKQVILPAVVSDVVITGPADRMDRLFADLKSYAAACSAYSSTGQRVKFSRFVLSCNPGKAVQGVLMKYISIKFLAS